MNTNVEVRKETHPETHKEKTLTPYAEVWNSEEKTLIVLDMPGVDESTLQVNFHENELKVEAKPLNLGITSALAYREFQLGKYFRKFNVSGSYDLSKTQANYKNGQLLIYLYKKQPLAIQIPVTVG